jgi:hypothetical protein
MKNPVLQAHRKQVAETMRALCTASAGLADLRDKMDAARTAEPDAKLDQDLLRFNRAAYKLLQSVMDMTDECWAIMLADAPEKISMADVRRAFGETRAVAEKITDAKSRAA